MTPFPHCYSCSTHQLPPAPSDLKVLLHRGETSSPVSKSTEGGKCQHPSRGGGVLLSAGATRSSQWHVQVPGSLLDDQARNQSQLQLQHLCRPTCAPAALHLDPGCLQALRVGLRNYFYISVRAYNMQRVICIIPPLPPCPSLSTNTSASWNFCFLYIIVFLDPGCYSTTRFPQLPHAVQSQSWEVEQKEVGAGGGGDSLS